MPKNISTSSVIFQPKSFKDLYEPLNIVNQYQRELENSYTELTDKADTYGSLANQQLDPQAYAQYKKYSDDLRAEAENLIQNGSNNLSRRRMLDIRRRYAQEMTPIVNAYNQREEDKKLWKQLMLSGKNIMTSYDPNTTSLDAYMNGTQGSLYAVDNDKIYSDAQNAAKTFSTRLTEITKDPNLAKQFNNDYYFLTQTKGVPAGVAFEQLAQKYPQLNQMKDEYLNSLNLTDNMRDRANNSYISGFNSGLVYDRDVKPMDNWRAKEALAHSYRQKEIDYANSNNNKGLNLKNLELPNIRRYAYGFIDDKAANEAFTTDRKQQFIIKDMLAKYKRAGLLNKDNSISKFGNELLHEFIKNDNKLNNTQKTFCRWYCDIYKKSGGNGQTPMNIHNTKALTYYEQEKDYNKNDYVANNTSFATLPLLETSDKKNIINKLFNDFNGNKHVYNVLQGKNGKKEMQTKPVKYKRSDLEKMLKDPTGEYSINFSLDTGNMYLDLGDGKLIDITDKYSEEYKNTIRQMYQLAEYGYDGAYDQFLKLLASPFGNVKLPEVKLNKEE